MSFICNQLVITKRKREMKNPIKVMLIAVLVISVMTLAFVLLKKDKIVLEDEAGQRYVGYSAKVDIDRTPNPDED